MMLMNNSRRRMAIASQMARPSVDRSDTTKNENDEENDSTIAPNSAPPAPAAPVLAAAPAAANSRVPCTMAGCAMDVGRVGDMKDHFLTVHGVERPELKFQLRVMTLKRMPLEISNPKFQEAARDINGFKQRIAAAEAFLLQNVPGYTSNHGLDITTMEDTNGDLLSVNGAQARVDALRAQHGLSEREAQMQYGGEELARVRLATEALVWVSHRNAANRDVWNLVGSMDRKFEDVAVELEVLVAAASV